MVMADDEDQIPLPTPPFKVDARHRRHQPSHLRPKTRGRPRRRPVAPWALTRLDPTALNPSCFLAYLRRGFVRRTKGLFDKTWQLPDVG